MGIFSRPTAYRHALLKRTFTHFTLIALTALCLAASGCGSDTQPAQVSSAETRNAAMAEDEKQKNASSKDGQTPKAIAPVHHASQTDTSNDAQPKLKPMPSQKDASAVLVYTSAEAIQCEFDGHPPSKTAESLTAAGVTVLRSYCGQRTGMMVAAMCGRGTTKINLHEISSEGLDEAAKAGYRAVTDLAQGSDKGYEIVECQTNDR